VKLGFAEHLEHFSRRFVQEVIEDATAAYYLKRAQAFEAAKPKPDDYHGKASREDLRAQWLRLDELAKACRARAKVSPLPGRTDPDLDNVLGEVA
jgi:hypothetical protein